MGREPGLSNPQDLPASVEAGLIEADRLIDAALNDEPVDDDAVLHALARLGAMRLDGHEAPRAMGAVYTPYSVAAQLVALAEVGPRDRVLDPAAGGGVFLLAAAEAQLTAGASFEAIAEQLRR